MGSGCLSDGYERRKTAALISLSNCVEHAISYGETFKFDPDHFQDQLVVGHFIALVEIGHSIQILCANEKVSDAKILLRTMFDTLLCLRAATSSKSEADRQRMQYALNSLKKMKQAQSGNLYLQAQYSRVPLDSEIAGVQQHIKELQAEGVGKPYSPILLAQKFATNEEYDGLYGSLSEQSHATFESILERSVTINHKTMDFEFTGFKRPPIARLEAIVIQTVEWISHATADLKHYSNNDS